MKIDNGYETPDDDREIPPQIYDINCIVKIQSYARRYIANERISNELCAKHIIEIFPDIAWNEGEWHKWSDISDDTPFKKSTNKSGIGNGD